LRLAFVCFNPLPLHLDTPCRRPLGGSESSLCYPAEALAGRGHQVAVLHRGPGPAVSRSVCCLPLHERSVRQLGPLDALVLLNLAGRARDFRPLLDRQTLLILWSQHHLDQPAVQPSHDPAERGRYDGFALVSEWQRQEYLRHFGPDLQRSGVLRNGIAPAFQNLFPAGTTIRERKTRPPVLAYPNTYPETSCIAALEALAAGCTVVTSGRGALPETTAGFARLVPVETERDTYRDRFVEATVRALASWAGAEAAAEEHLQRQVANVHQQHTWPALAKAWSGWLRRLRAHVAP
jgi:hypothetical protein